MTKLYYVHSDNSMAIQFFTAPKAAWKDWIRTMPGFKDFFVHKIVCVNGVSINIKCEYKHRRIFLWPVLDVSIKHSIGNDNRYQFSSGANDWVELIDYLTCAGDEQINSVVTSLGKFELQEFETEQKADNSLYTVTLPGIYNFTAGTTTPKPECYKKSKKVSKTRKKKNAK